MIPVGAVQMTFVLRIIDNNWRIHQIQATESGIYFLGSREFAPQFPGYPPELVECLTHRAHLKEIERLRRYEACLNCQIEKDLLSRTDSEWRRRRKSRPER